MRDFAGMIFDFNGVLLWDSPLHEQAWREYITMLRGYPFNDEEVENRLHGRVNRDILEYALQRKLNADELHVHSMQKENNYRDLCLGWPEFRLSPGAVNLLDRLKEQGVPRTIATASEITNLKFYFEHLQLSKWFDFERVIFDNGTFPGKPNPAIYQRAAQALNIEPRRCVVVEDAVSGIAAAFAAGIGRIVALCPLEKAAYYTSLPGVHSTIASLEQFDREIFTRA